MVASIIAGCGFVTNLGIERTEAQHEKSIDLRIGLDIVHLARNNPLDVAVTFNQD